ncbi:MAG: prolyl oligopeptidase family serine peptidase [Fimbriimonas sp.]|nr:prolyl oligopeptidase family serine peptidase [Fimbriimonas sp.]
MRSYSFFAATAACFCLSVAYAQKKPLDHSVYDAWKSIRGTTISHDGKWILYTIAPQEGDAITEVRSLESDRTISIARGNAAQFSNDSKFVVALVAPPQAETKKATKDKLAADKMPKNALAIVDLSTGEQTKIDKVKSFKLAAEDSGWLTYRPEPPKAETAPSSSTSSKPAAATSAATGTPLVIRNLSKGKEERIENVLDSVMTKDGSILAYSIASKDGKGDGVVYLNLSNHKRTEVFEGKGKDLKLGICDETKALAIVTDRSANPPASNDKATSKSAESPLSVAFFDPNTLQVKWLAGPATTAIPKNWSISENSPLSFSDHGTRVFFGTAPTPAKHPKDETPESEKVSLDVWTWQDKRIMPQQILQASADQKRTYRAIAFVGSGKVLQVETLSVPDVTIGEKGEGAYGIGSSDEDYRLASSWDEGYADISLIDLRSGQTHSLFKRSESRPSFSPSGKVLAFFDYQAKQYAFLDAASLKRTDVNVPAGLTNELTDTPSTHPAFGEAGWSRSGDRLLIYSDKDIWSLDPTGRTPPKNLTGSSLHMVNLRFRYVNTDPESNEIDLSKPLLLSAFNVDTKDAGFYSLNVTGTSPVLKRLIFDHKIYGVPILAKTKDLVAYTQQDFVEFPDVWIAKPDFTSRRKLTNANPQQTQYNWGTAELVNWESSDGQQLQGILIKPEDFSYGKKYPMITYFYERLSDSLNAYHTPAPSPSTINPSYFASNGYLIFIPDIPYKTGYPGESAVSAILSGVLSIVSRGYVDSERLGIQGHSWGGYEVAYLVTRTNLFKCAAAGAAVADMFSAYGGIRYGAGILREGQYEHGQSRIGASPWDRPLRYLENSPLFYLDKVETPLLMLHNDKDGAVPFTQGIELFSGLRRLQKPVWMCVYNGEDHNLVERKNRKDWSIRLAQYFDHFLKDKPMPVWMSKGIPATMKGTTLGLDFDGPADHGP